MLALARSLCPRARSLVNDAPVRTINSEGEERRAEAKKERKKESDREHHTMSSLSCAKCLCTPGAPTLLYNCKNNHLVCETCAHENKASRSLELMDMLFFLHSVPFLPHSAHSAPANHCTFTVPTHHSSTTQMSGR